MGPRTFTADGRAAARPDASLSGLVDFCVDSFNTCFSRDADKLCVPVGLGALSALLSLLACFPLVYRKCAFRGENPGQAVAFLYSLLGNLCGATGAVLSGQPHIQVLVGVSAAVTDAVGLISCCLHVLLCWNSKAERRLRMIKGRRRQHLLAVSVLMVVAGGFLKSRVTHLPADGPLSGRRRLLHATLLDNTEILGYVLGLLSFIIACTSRFPALCRAYNGHTLTRAYVFSGLLCSLAGALYAAAILLYDTHFGFLLRVMPWLLSAMCCVTLDLLIVFVHWWKKGTRQRFSSLSPDTESLLGGSGIPTEDKCAGKRPRNQHIHLSARTKAKNVQQMSEMGRYMDVSVQPAGKACLKEMILSKEEVGEQPLDRTVKLIRVDSSCSSCTSCDSSPVGSDLEWDFEEANARWREPTAKQQEGANLWSCAVFGLPQKTLSGIKEVESVSSASLAK